MSRTPTPAALSLAALAVGLGGCVINGDKYPRPRDLEPSTYVHKLRLLAIATEPPELRPGESASVSALLVDPLDQVSTTVWVACDGEDVTDFGCPFDPSGLDGDPTPEQLAELGVIGFEPGFPPVYTAPDDALDGLEGRDRLEGVQAVVQALALPEQSEDTDDFDFNQVESGFKRVVISEDDTPNLNPTPGDFTADGIPIGPEDVIEFTAGQRIELDIDLEPAVETYTYVNTDGETETRTEEPFITWYTDWLQVEQEVTLYPDTPCAFTAPRSAPDVEGRIWAVIRDRRGGISWEIRRWRLVEE